VAVTPVQSLQVADPSQVGAARRAAMDMARASGFDEPTVAQLSLIVTEAGSNLVKHGQGGHLLLQVVEEGGRRQLEVVALDRGPGIANVPRSLQDGYSTAGSPGTGLGAVQRAASAFDIYSRRGAGTAVLARLVDRMGGPGSGRHHRMDVGGLSVAMPGEDACGDVWDEESGGNGTTILVADGLGHGPGAAEAAMASVTAFRSLRGRGPAIRLEAIHAALRSTRGAAVGIGEIDLDARVVRFAGLGNISARLVRDGAVRHLVSHNGTAGHIARKIDEFTYPWAPDDRLVMHTDGLATQRDLDAYPGLMAHHPSLVAAVLYRDFTRGRDDATIVVVREHVA
jgi:anti-sigma regulatory factor (Ser/Thr protein kinase)